VVKWVAIISLFVAVFLLALEQVQIKQQLGSLKPTKVASLDIVKAQVAALKFETTALYAAVSQHHKDIEELKEVLGIVVQAFQQLIRVHPTPKKSEI
jgi:hypothetical protein